MTYIERCRILILMLRHRGEPGTTSAISFKFNPRQNRLSPALFLHRRSCTWMTTQSRGRLFNRTGARASQTTLAARMSGVVACGARLPRPAVPHSSACTMQRCSLHIHTPHGSASEINLQRCRISEHSAQASYGTIRGTRFIDAVRDNASIVFARTI